MLITIIFIITAGILILGYGVQQFKKYSPQCEDVVYTGNVYPLLACGFSVLFIAAGAAASATGFVCLIPLLSV